VPHFNAKPAENVEKFIVATTVVRRWVRKATLRKRKAPE
jgi:hypothetical protein